MQKLVYCFTTIICLSLLLHSHAQNNPATEWFRTYGGSRLDDLSSVTPLSSGGYILGGYTGSIDGDLASEDKTESPDMWIVELDSQQNIVRQATYGATGRYVYEQIQNIIPLAEGGYVITGHASSFTDDFSELEGKGSQDFLIGKLNDTLGLEWIKNYGGSGAEGIYDFKPTPDGGYIAVGYTTSEDGDIQNKENEDSDDWWFVKFDNKFNIQYEKTFGGSGPGNYLQYESAYSVTVLENGNYAIVGSTSSNDGDLAGAGLGDTDVTVLVVNDTLGTVWTKTYGGSARDMGTDIIQSSDDDLVFTAYTISIDGTMEGLLIGSYDIWVAKLNPDNGDIIWTDLYGGTGAEAGNAGLKIEIIETSDGNLVFAGSTGKADGDIAAINGGSVVVWLVKLNQDGEILWENTYGTPQKDFIKSIQELEDGSILLAGDNGDWWLTKIRPCPENVALSATICSNENYDFNGTLLNEAGEYKDTLQTVGGCDSIITLTLNVNPAPNPVIVANGNELSAESFAAYQWLLDGDSLENSSQNHTADAMGSYQVMVTNNEGCSATSKVFFNAIPSQDDFPLRDKYVWNFEIENVGTQVSAHTFYEDSIEYSMEGGAYTTDYSMLMESYDATENRWIGVGKGGSIDKTGKYFVLFFKEISEDSVLVYKREAANQEEAYTFPIPAENATEDHGWNWYKKETTGTGLFGFRHQGLEVFPNPTSGDLNVEINSQKAYQAQLVTVEGLEVLSTPLQNGRISLHHLPNGIYLLKLYDGIEMIGVQKIIKK